MDLELIKIDEVQKNNLHPVLQRHVKSGKDIYVAYVTCFQSSHLLQDAIPTIIKIAFTIHRQKFLTNCLVNTHSPDVDKFELEDGEFFITIVDSFQILEDYGKRSYGSKECCYWKPTFGLKNMSNTISGAKKKLQAFKKRDLRFLEEQYNSIKI